MNSGTNTTLSTETLISAPVSADDACVDQFINRVEDRLAKGAGGVVVDCSRLERVTSSHIRGLWLAHETCTNKGAQLTLENVSEGLRRVLTALNLIPIFLKETVASTRLDLEVSPTVEAIDGAISTLTGFLTRSGLPPITAFELQSIFYEVATNIRQHGGLKPEDSFTVVTELGELAATFVFTDPGVEFDPTVQKSKPDIQEAGRKLQRRGFGLAMMKGLSSTITYTRTADHKNQLTITKRW